MLKRLLGSVSFFAILLIGVGSSKAALNNLSDSKLLFDVISGLVWYRSVGDFKDQSYLEQLNTISNLNIHYDINGDGLVDELAWDMADVQTVGDLIVNYNLQNLNPDYPLNENLSRDSFFEHFSTTYSYWPDNIYWQRGVKGYIKNSTDDSYGLFIVRQAYRFPTWTSPDAVYGIDVGPYGGGIEIEENWGDIPLPGDDPNDGGIIGPPDIYPEDYPDWMIDMDATGAWVVAVVSYATPIPSSLIFLGAGLLGFTGAFRRGNNLKD